jgi:hypothetical protein
VAAAHGDEAVNASGAITYILAVAFWLVTACYALLASREFIVEQFLKPGLFAPLTVFATFWPAFAIAILVLWVSARRLLLRHRELMFTAPLTVWVVAVIASLAPGVTAMVVGPVAFGVAMTALLMLWLLATAEHPVPQGAVNVSSGHTSADFFACVLAAVAIVIVEAAVHVARVRGVEGIEQVLIGVARTQLLVAMVAFLALTMVRACGAMVSRQVTAEARFAIVALGALFGWFLYRVAFASISLDGAAAGVAAYLGGYAIAVAITTPAIVAFSDRTDGLRSVAGAFAPRLAGRWVGFVGWIAVVAGLAVAFDAASRIADWNFVLARTGVVVVWLCLLAAALRVVKTPASGHAAVFLGFAVAVLAAHVALDRPVAAATETTALTPATRFAADLLRPAAAGPAELYALLPKHTNIAGPGTGTPVDVNWAALSGPPSANRPNIFLFVVDSLRRDYVSAYNDRVTFTPAIGAFARESLVFERAFTQYGATGLSVPSIWVGGPILHKQYVTPFAPMNALGKLLAHEQYAQWISVDNIVDVILPKSAALDPLDRNRPVKDFRFCATLDEIRARLAARAADAPPVFAYTLPQDVHISVITREGARAIDAQSYDGFYAPVASRVRRFDACFGAFIDDLKSKGIYDNSVVVLTSDHGDSLGEDGRMGHAYTLYPEIARLPLIVHVPASMRADLQWDTNRAAYTTDLTPTLFRLLGHEPGSPGEMYGESLARTPGSTAGAQRDRMIASSYGAVYGAVMRGGTSIYVADAIERREMQFTIGAGADAGQPVGVDAATRREATRVITTTVTALAGAYRYSPPN